MKLTVHLLEPRRIGSPVACGIQIISLVLALAPAMLAAPTALDEDSPWPRVRSTNGNTVTMYLPQVERWTTNWFVAQAVVGVKPARTKKEQLGVVWFEAQGTVDRSTRLVALDRLEITRGSFPDAPDNGSNDLALVRELFPGGARTVSLDYLITALGFEEAAARPQTQPLNHNPPDIIWVTNPSVLVVIDGEPVFRPMAGTALERVINTPALLVRDPAGGRLYLSGESQWFAADALAGPWSLAQIPPPDVAAFSPASTNAPAAAAGQGRPRILVSTRPAELLMTDGAPNFQPIRGTQLQYAANSDNQLFFYVPERQAYLLLSGRWFRANSLDGPWTYVAPKDLPDDFADIPRGSPQAVVLASVPGTPEAEQALIASSVPTTATVRRDTKLEFAYDGEPQFKPIAGTSLLYAVNAPLPVIRAGESYYAADKGVWFTAAAPAGPWQVAAEVPQEIYTIPPDSPVYYATFVRVYDADTNSVEVGYTSGYTGAYEDDGTMVYGTGYNYEPWCSTTTTTYYGWGYTWGYGYLYSPWYGWWTWRPSWNNRGGLRAAVIDNIYDRWQSGNHVTPHDRRADAASSPGWPVVYGGYPALYGRFQSGARPTPWSPPPNTLALNPYSRPPTTARAGSVPGGAQLLDTVRQSPGGGRDLYASPDGNIYQRKSDGWYRRGAGGKWDYYAPVQGAGQRKQSAAAQGVSASRTGGRNTGTAAPVAASQPRGRQVAGAAPQALAQNAAELDRQYYARQLGQARAQNARPAVRPAPVRSAPVRAGGGRRR
ncbi:MAG TPA: hypothetical protein VMB80_01405 [Candidatus Acidoferrum sp.]|nr:hypothetical protein [Candidatus Acidoferrum sp.]